MGCDMTRKIFWKKCLLLQKRSIQNIDLSVIESFKHFVIRLKITPIGKNFLQISCGIFVSKSHNCYIR